MKSLFNEFSPSTAADWKAQLMKDLKGELYESLVWHNENGFDIEPYYTSENLKADYPPAFTHADWSICVKSDGAGPEKSNAFFLKSLNRGADSIHVNSDCSDYEVLLKDIQLQHIQSSFVISPDNIDALSKIITTGKNAGDLLVSVFCDDLNTLQKLNAWIQKTSELNVGHLKTVSADVYGYHNQNCLAYYEVALAISIFIEYLIAFELSGQKLPASKFVIKAGVSADYFIQIAKLRAMRRLWKIICEVYGISNELHIIVETSLSNKSVSDSYNNLLRSSVEAMAAVAGGCDELIVNSLDVFLSQKSELASRMAVNQQLILKDEVYMDKVADISCGSYFIESVTDRIAEKALQTVKEIEKDGGYFAGLEGGRINAEIQKQAQHKSELFNSGAQVAVGVNKFRNDKEKPGLRPELAAQMQKHKINNPLISYELDLLSTTKHA